VALNPQVITAGMTNPEPIQSPNDIAEGLAKTRVYQGQADELAAQAQERVKAAADDAAARTALMAHPNDPDAAIGTLVATGHPNAAFKIQSTLTAQRKAAAEAADAEIKTHTARANYIGQSLNGADPTNQADWSTRVNGILAQFQDPNERAQMAQQLAGVKTADDVAKIRSSGETTEQYLNQQQSALALLASGKPTEAAASLLLSQPDQAHYDAALSGMKSMFPASVVAQMPTTFGPDSQAQLKQLAIPVAEQERLKGEAAARAQTAKNENANLAVSQARLKVEQDRERREADTAAKASQPPPEIKPGTPDFKVAQDLAYGRMTPGFFRTLQAYNRDAGKKSALYAKAAELNPDFNEADFERGFKFISSPRVASQLASLDNVQSGVNDLLKASDAAKRSGSPSFNKWVVSPVSSSVLGNKKYSNFQTAVTAFADELSGALGYGSATDMSREMGYKMTDPNQSPDTFRSNIEDIVIPFVERKRASLLKQGSVYGTSANNSSITAPPSSDKTVTTAELQMIAKRNGTTIEQEKARATAAGYVIR
jgi:hypothetical protein